MCLFINTHSSFYSIISVHYLGCIKKTEDILQKNEKVMKFAEKRLKVLLHFSDREKTSHLE